MNVVFLHGFGENHEVWQNLHGLLGTNHHYFFPNYSELLHCQSMEQYADWLNAELDLIGKNHKFVIFGHSMGGYLALEFLNKYPDKVHAFGLINSTAKGDTADKQNNRDKVIEFIDKNGSSVFLESFYPKMFSDNFKLQNLDLINENIRKFSKIPKKALINATLAMKNRVNYSLKINQFQKKSLWIIGKKDNFVYYKDAIKQAECSKLSSIFLDENSAHASMYENTQGCAETINQFIDNLNF